MAKSKTPSAGKKPTRRTNKATAKKPDVSKSEEATKSSASKAGETVSNKAKAKDSTSDVASKSTEASVPETSNDTAKNPLPVEKSKEPVAMAESKVVEAKSDPKVDAKTPSSQEPSKPEPAPVAPPTRTNEPVSVFWPMVFGGLIAAGLGFAASEFNLFRSAPGTDAIEQTLAEQQRQIAELQSEEPQPTADLSGIQESLSNLSETLSTLEVRLAELEARPVAAPSTDGSDVADQYASEFAALQSSVQAQQDEIARLLENAQDVEAATAQSAQQAAVQAALTQITTALSSGSGFAAAVEDLSENGVDAIPPALANTATEGVAALSALQSEFPDAARAGLNAARAAGLDGGEGGVGGFLRRQLGARSVTPREGEDPDAVLSRAEAAVRAGNLTEALAEMDGLPAEVQSAMEAWLAPAKAREEAESALQTLTETLTAN